MKSLEQFIKEEQEKYGEDIMKVWDYKIDTVEFVQKLFS